MGFENLERADGNEELIDDRSGASDAPPEAVIFGFAEDVILLRVTPVDRGEFVAVGVAPAVVGEAVASVERADDVAAGEEHGLVFGQRHEEPGDRGEDVGGQGLDASVVLDGQFVGIFIVADEEVGDFGGGVGRVGKGGVAVDDVCHG